MTRKVGYDLQFIRTHEEALPCSTSVCLWRGGIEDDWHVGEGDLFHRIPAHLYEEYVALGSARPVGVGPIRQGVTILYVGVPLPVVEALRGKE